MKFGGVTEVSTFLVIIQVSSGLKKSHILIFSKYKYLHVKIASLANVKSCVSVARSNSLMFSHVSPSGLPLRLSPRYFTTTVLWLSQSQL